MEILPPSSHWIRNDLHRLAWTQWKETRDPDIPFALIFDRWNKTVYTIAESYVKHCKVQTAVNIQDRVRKYSSAALKQADSDNVLKSKDLIEINLDSKQNFNMDAVDLAQFLKQGINIRVTHELVISLNQIYHEIYAYAVLITSQYLFSDVTDTN
ncbi:hypothetical protein MIR68_004928 [Amoeboaphelidium protococcarum]|nr:hypothetical protein MIR68_004928 [Amoeboaphelidium protococcarum]KAI3653282.1 hypothetical protein MP228_001229 [Amoeboaphelidium protococcarum]